jgi:hypothetical protein
MWREEVERTKVLELVDIFEALVVRTVLFEGEMTSYSWSAAISFVMGRGLFLTRVYHRDAMGVVVPVFGDRQSP